MNDRDKKLIALLSAAIIILGVTVVLAVSVYSSPYEETRIEYVTGTTAAQVQTQATTSALHTETTTFAENQQPTTQQATENRAVLYEQTTVVQEQTTSAPETEASASINVSAMSESEILAMLTEAINKTKAYKGDVSVKHTESFDADVTECTGGSIVATAANALVGMVLTPTDETLNFSGGTAANSEGETVTILLPQKGNFSLGLNGISSISASTSGNETVINVTLVPESVGINEIPKANSAGVGYLDVASLDLSILEITSADIVYTGSTMEAHIRPDGYISYAKYTIPMHVEGSAKSGMISGSAVFDGMQTETWQFNWN